MQKFIFILMLGLLTGCSGLQFPGVYKIPVEQGNIITQEMIDQLKPGMSQAQVEYVLGSPLVKDTFNASRWDYVYSIQRGDKARKQHRLSIFFDTEKNLKSFSGDFLPEAAKPNADKTAS